MKANTNSDVNSQNRKEGYYSEVSRHSLPIEVKDLRTMTSILPMQQV